MVIRSRCNALVSGLSITITKSVVEPVLLPGDMWASSAVLLTETKSFGAGWLFSISTRLFSTIMFDISFACCLRQL